MLLDVLDESLLHNIRQALAEDIGSGDITAELIPAARQAGARLICRENAILCGTAWFDAVFKELDSHIRIDWQARDGEIIQADQLLCTLSGPARPLLSGERTALNFLQTLSATATLSHRYAERVSDLPVRILDTRKTIPGLRQAQKYAVRTGGCENHRSGLYDAFLIKENHITAAGSIGQAVDKARSSHPDTFIEVEVETEMQLQQALDASVDRVLLDNHSLEQLVNAVRVTAGRTRLEASGGVTLDNVRDIALTGVDYISTGNLTKDISAIDLSMIFE